MTDRLRHFAFYECFFVLDEQKKDDWMPDDEQPQPLELDRFVGGKIRTRRIELKKSRANLAQEIGASRAEIISFEFGWRRPKPAQLLQLADALKVRVGYFFEGIEG